MKKLILGISLMFASSLALAQHHGHVRHGHGFHGHHHHAHIRHHLHARHWHPHYGWVAPVVIGGAVTYALTRPNPVIVQSPVVVEQPIIQNIEQPAPNCTPWVETKQPDGTILQTRTCQ